MSDENLNEIDDLAKIREIVESYRESVAEAREQKNSLKKRSDEIQAELNKLYLEQRDLDRKLTEDSDNIRLLEQRAVQLARQKEQEDEQRRIAGEFDEASKRFDELTSSAFWREFAFSFQIEGAKRLSVAKRAILGDKRGLGKTLTSIITMDMVEAKKILVICINDVAPQFADEIRHWAPHRIVLPLQGLPPTQRDILYPTLSKMSDIVCTINYEAWRRDKGVVDALLRVGFDMVVIDEAHKMKEWSKITARGIGQLVMRPNFCNSCETIDIHVGDWSKNGLIDFDPEDRDSKRIYAYSTCKNCGATADWLSNTAKVVLPMTGTPILNKPQEMFSLLHICYPHLFPREIDFLRDFCMQISGRWMFQFGGEKRLANLIKEFFVQRSREDTDVEVPPPAITVHRLDKDTVTYKKQYENERQLAEASCLLLEQLEDSYDIFYMLEIILRLRQCMTWPNGIILRDRDTKEIICRLDTKESQKLDAIADFVNDLVEENERVVVFSQFKEPLYELQRRLGEDISVVATGDQSHDFRADVLEDFDLKTYINDPSRIPRWNVLLGTYKAFSTGLNLNAARHVVIMDDEWNPGSEDQAIGRIDRINSTDQANVHIFRVKESIDDFMAALLEQKRQMVGGFEGTVSASDMFKDLRNFLGGM